MNHNNLESEQSLVPAHEHHEHEHSPEVDRLWEESNRNEIVAGFIEGKEVDEVVAPEELEKAFAEVPCCLGCSDGRIHDIRLGRAGMGIVAGVSETVESIKKLHKEGKIKENFTITSHTGCGAAKIVCNQLIEQGKLPADTEPDSLGVKFAHDVVKGLWAEGIKAGYHHIEGDKMDKHHDERAIYFDGTGKLNIETLVKKDGKKVFPRGFIFSALDFSDKATETELKALCGIALGDHGFGHRFTIDTPFYIVITTESKQKKERYTEIAEKVAKNFHGRVRVKAYVPSGISIDK
ncbi:hypothetical protein HGA34_05920 [Candidatus Falkowbacteria bacterium]|nr:hypothetical protein [Candidatus Falkowbacteria bacterium]